MRAANGIRHAWPRRLVALLAVVSMLFAPLEAVAIPDVHDGDGQAQAAAELSGGVHSPAESDEAHVGDPQSCRSPGAPLPGHSTHVDHCVHGHTFTPLDASASREVGDWPAGGVAGENDALHESADPAPRLRPPIA